ncbi:hypothetical protein BKG89_00970 [Rodentibacter caecimuris]|uniref:Uncharacterized protein n=1 Tax=Rodentibacter caecimuris TaxID=1796644 RepID=A0ABX3KZL7_9PAST|nr:hypothetical protein BKG89_00970 [Rodentibacter heylii]
MSSNAKLKIGQEANFHSKFSTVEAENKVRIAGPAGTFIIDRDGITLKGKTTVKGQLITTGGSPEKIQSISFLANDEEEVCKVCKAMQNTKKEVA